MARQKKTARAILDRLLLALSLLALCTSAATAQEALWKTYLDAGAQALAEKDYAVAEKRYALALKEAKNFGEKDARLAVTLLQLAVAYAEQDKFDEARPRYDQAVAIWDSSPTMRVEWVALINRLGTIYKNKGNFAEAASMFELGISKLDKARGTKHPQLISLYTSLGDIYYAQDKYEEAMSAYKQALALREKRLGMEHDEVAVSAFWVGRSYAEMSKHAEAKPFYQRALNIMLKSAGAESEVAGIILTIIGDNHAALKEFADAERSYEKALKIKEKTGASNDALANVLEKYAAVLREMKRENEAAPLAARAKTLRAKSEKEKEKER
jgi:tetratricopeptide (TPR) repeat protein